MSEGPNEVHEEGAKISLALFETVKRFPEASMEALHYAIADLLASSAMHIFSTTDVNSTSAKKLFQGDENLPEAVLRLKVGEMFMGRVISSAEQLYSLYAASEVEKKYGGTLKMVKLSPEEVKNLMEKLKKGEEPNGPLN